MVMRPASNHPRGLTLNGKGMIGLSYLHKGICVSRVALLCPKVRAQRLEAAEPTQVAQSGELAATLSKSSFGLKGKKPESCVLQKNRTNQPAFQKT